MREKELFEDGIKGKGRRKKLERGREIYHSANAKGSNEVMVKVSSYSKSLDRMKVYWSSPTGHFF